MSVPDPKEGELWRYVRGNNVYKIEKIFRDESGKKVAKIRDVETDFVCEEYGFNSFAVKDRDKYYWELFRGDVQPIKTPEPESTERQVIEI